MKRSIVRLSIVSLGILFISFETGASFERSMNNFTDVPTKTINRTDSCRVIALNINQNELISKDLFKFGNNPSALAKKVSFKPSSTCENNSADEQLFFTKVEKDSGFKIRVGSYNLRVDAKADYEGGNGWNIRQYGIAKIIKEHDIDILGTQEGDYEQMDDLVGFLPGYKYIGYPYGGPTGRSHTASILYKASIFEPLKQGEFWYSETPDVQSIGWDATDLRICTWAKMKFIPTGQVFYFFSSHFYWRYKTAMMNSGKVLVEEIKKIDKDNLPVISTGDLNSEPSTPQIKDILTLLKDSRSITETPPTGPYNTAFHGGVFQGKPNFLIDYIFVSNSVQVLSYSVLTDANNNGLYPSDHFPVICDLLLK